MSNPANLMKYMNDPDVAEMMAAFQSDIPQDFDPAKFAAQQAAAQGQPQEAPKEPEMKQEEPTPAPTPAPAEPAKPKVEREEAEAEKALGTACYKKRDIEGAIAHYSKAIELEPQWLLYRSNLIACYIEQKNFDLAIETCEEAVKVFNESDFDQRKVEHLAKIYSRKARV